MAGAMEVPRVEDVFAAVGLGQVMSELGSQISRGSNNGAGGALQLVALLYIAYARAVGRIEVAHHLGHTRVPSLPEACLVTLCCAPCASVQEIDALAAAYVEIQENPPTSRQNVEVVYEIDLLPDGLACFCRCCYMADTAQRDTGLLPLPLRKSARPNNFSDTPPLLMQMARA